MLRSIRIAAIAALAPLSLSAQGLPYSPIVEVNGVLYVAGKLGQNPETRKLPGNIEEETKFALEAVKKELEGAGATMADVVRCQVFLDDIDDYSKMNGVYGTFFPENPPARTTLAVEDIVLGAKIEIECTAVRGRGEAAESQ
ncbi:MAG: RidA family protein [Pseudomonadota bacterium]